MDRYKHCTRERLSIRGNDTTHLTPALLSASHLSSWSRPSACSVHVLCFFPADLWLPVRPLCPVPGLLFPTLPRPAFQQLASSILGAPMPETCPRAASQPAPDRQENTARPLAATRKLGEVGSPGKWTVYTKPGTSCQMLIECLNGKFKCCGPPFSEVPLSSLKQAPSTALSPKS